MLAPIISMIVISLSIMNMGSIYSARVANTVNFEKPDSMSSYISQEKMVLTAVDFYCQSNPEKCYSKTDTKVILSINEVLKYSPIKNLKSFNIGTISSIYVDMNNNEIKLNNDFKSEKKKIKYLSNYRIKKDINKECESGVIPCSTEKVISPKRFSPKLEIAMAEIEIAQTETENNELNMRDRINMIKDKIRHRF